MLLANEGEPITEHVRDDELVLNVCADVDERDRDELKSIARS